MTAYLTWAYLVWQGISFHATFLAVRRIKFNPADPSWTFPFATRERIERLEEYFSTFHLRKKNWGSGNKVRQVLDENRKVKIPWESVPPHRRHIAQAYFDKRIAMYQAQGRAITQGIVNSSRCLATRFSRSTPWERARKCEDYGSKKKMWLAYQDWLSKQQRAEFVARQEPNEHKVLPV
jgi:hypothetical protein